MVHNLDVKKMDEIILDKIIIDDCELKKYLCENCYKKIALMFWFNQLLLISIIYIFKLINKG